MTRDPIDEFSVMVAVYEPPLVNIGVCSFTSRKIEKASYSQEKGTGNYTHLFIGCSFYSLSN